MVQRTGPGGTDEMSDLDPLFDTATALINDILDIIDHVDRKKLSVREVLQAERARKELREARAIIHQLKGQLREENEAAENQDGR